MKEYIEYSFTPSGKNLLMKKVRCGSCGFSMYLSNTKNAKYYCRMRNLENGYNCSDEGLWQEDLYEMIVILIQTYAAYAVSLENLMLLQKEQIQAEMKQARRELAVLQSKKDQLEKSLQELYEKLIDGSVDKESYLLENIFSSLSKKTTLVDLKYGESFVCILITLKMYAIMYTKESAKECLI